MLLLPGVAATAEKGLTVKSVRSFSYSAFTRIVFEVEAAAPYVRTKTPDGKTLFLSAYDGPFALASSLPLIHDGIVNGIELKDDAGRKTILIQLGPAAGEAKDFVLRGPDRIVLDIAKGAAAAAPVPQPDKPIVIMLDPGHGGRDTGIITARGQEKSITLEVAHAIKKLLQRNQRLNVLLTRDNDRMLSLDERAAEANAKGAEVFISIHMAAGVHEHIYIQDPDEDAAEQPAKRANSDFLGFESGSRQEEMLWGRQQAAHAKESGLLGRILAREFSGKDESEPLQAPLAALKAINAPAIVLEAGMEQDRTRTAEAVAKGIERYVGENR